jgi:hypothetical protein
MMSNTELPEGNAGPVDNTGTEQVDTGTENDTGGNPAWNDLLSQIPDNLHHLVTPHLQKWDQGVQQRFSQLQKEQSGYAPYKDFVEQGVDPQAIQQALAVMSMINDKPDQFYNEMQTYYKDDPRFQQQSSDQGQQEPEVDLGGEPPKFNIEDDPRFQQMQQQQEIIANFLGNQVTEQQNAQEDAALDQEMKALETKHGAYDEDYVLGLAQAGVPLEDAVLRYQGLVGKVRNAPTPGSNFPPVVTPGGGVPSTAIDPAGLTNKETRELIASFLATQNE